MFLSTSEKLGCDRLDELELPPEADGDEDDGLLVDESLELLPLDDGLLLDEDDCATASVDSANMTAAAVMLTVWRMCGFLVGWWKLHRGRRNRCARSASGCG